MKCGLWIICSETADTARSGIYVMVSCRVKGSLRSQLTSSFCLLQFPSAVPSFPSFPHSASLLTPVALQHPMHASPFSNPHLHPSVACPAPMHHPPAVAQPPSFQQTPSVPPAPIAVAATQGVRVVFAFLGLTWF